MCLDYSKFELTEDGYSIPGSAEALRKSREEFPTYADLLKRHSEHFRIKERLRELGF